jgi:hypothetical protein
VVIDGKRVKYRRVPKAINQKLSKGARRVKIVWKGLKGAKGKKVARTLVVPVKMTDERGKTTSLRLRVKRG